MTAQAKYCQYCGGVSDRFYSVDTVAVMLDTSPETVRSWVKDRRIGSVKFGRLRRIPARELEKMAQRFPSLEEIAKEAMI